MSVESFSSTPFIKKFVGLPQFNIAVPGSSRNVPEISGKFHANFRKISRKTPENSREFPPNIPHPPPPIHPLITHSTTHTQNFKTDFLDNENVIKCTGYLLPPSCMNGHDALRSGSIVFSIWNN